MAYLDYSRPDVPDFGEGLRHLGDALTHMMKRKQEREMQDQKLQFEREQEERRYAQQKGQFDYQNRIEDRKSRMGELDFNQRQNAIKFQRAEMVRKALAEGNTQLAQQIANETVQYDPHTGQETARAQLTQGPAREPNLPEPVKPDTADLPSAQETAAARGVAGVVQAIPGMPFSARPIEEAATEVDQQRAEDEGKLKRWQAESQAYRADVAKAEDERPYSLQMGKEPPITLDIATQRYAGRNRNAEDFLASFRGVQMSESDISAAQNVAAQLRSGTLDPGKAGAAFDKARFGMVAEAGRDTRSEGRDAAIVEAARLKANAPHVDLGERKFGYERERDRSRFLRDDLKRFLAENAAKEIGDADRETTNLQTNLASGEPGTIRNGLLKLWQIAQHDTRMSDKDAVLANNLDRSVLSTLEGWVSTGAEGVPGDLNLKAAQDTARRLRGYYVAKNSQLKDQYKSEFVNSGQYDPKEADVLGAQTFPGWNRITENQPAPKGRGTSGRRGIPEVDAKKKAIRVKASGSAVDDLLKLLEAP